MTERGTPPYLRMATPVMTRGAAHDGQAQPERVSHRPGPPLFPYRTDPWSHIVRASGETGDEGLAAATTATYGATGRRSMRGPMPGAVPRS